MPSKARLRGFSSFGRARPCQGRGGGFEPRNPLHKMGTIELDESQQSCPKYSVPWPSGKAKVCNTSIPGSIPGGTSKKISFFGTRFFIQSEGLVCHQVARLVCLFPRIDYIPSAVDYIQTYMRYELSKVVTLIFTVCYAIIKIIVKWRE